MRDDIDLLGSTEVIQERTSDGAVVNPRIKCSVSVIARCVFTKGVSVESQRRFCIMDFITPFLSDGATSSCSLVRKYHLVYIEDFVLHIGTNKLFNLFKLFRKKIYCCLFTSGSRREIIVPYVCRNKSRTGHDAMSLFA